MRKWRKGIKRILAMAMAAVLMGGSMEWSTLQVAATEMNEPILTEGEENITPEGTENTDNIIIEMESQVEYIELPELETSAMSMMMFALGANEKVPLKSTNHANWIDRLDLTGADYAMTFYNWLVENSDNDGTEDALIIPVEDGTSVKVVYGSLCYVLKEFTGTVDFTFAAGADGETISAAAGNAVNAAIAGQVDEVAKYAHTVYSAFDRDNPQVFWLDGASSVTSEVKSNISYSSNGTGTATYTQTIGFVLTNNDFDIRESKYAAMETAALRNKISEVNSQVNTILAGVSAQATDYEKVKYFNEWLTTHNCYNTNANLENAGNDAHECISALMGSVSTAGPVCEGYARAFKVLCDKVGIPCVLVDGNADNGSGNPEAHMWNYVQIGDIWYAIDVTWNDPKTGSEEAVSGSESEEYFLAGSDTSIRGKKFIESHPVSNTVTINGVAFTNGPTIATSAYVPPQPCIHDTNEYAVSGATITVVCSDCKEELGKATISAVNKTYDGAPGSASVEKTGMLAETIMNITYKVKEGADLNSAPVSAGTYIASITYGGVTANAEFTIAKENPTYAAPTANVLTYSGTAQLLVTAGDVQGVEMQYSLEKNGTYSTTIPTGTEAGDYTVWYKIVGGENYNDVEPASVGVTIGKATPTISVGFHQVI